MNRMPRMDDVYDPFIIALADGEEHAMADVKKSIEKQLELPEGIIQSTRENGTNILVSRVTWAGTYFVKAELAERPSYGIYRLTPKGRQLAASVCSGQLHLTNKYLMSIPAFAAYIRKQSAPSNRADSPIHPQPTPGNNTPTCPGTPDCSTRTTETTPAPTSETPATPPESPPEDTMAEAYHTITARLEDELLEQVLRKDFRFFEHLVVKLLEKMGYGAKFEKLNHTTPATNDGGIDALIYEDRLGFSIIYVQAKRYKPGNNIDLPKLHEFVGALAKFPGVNKGLFITTADFTAGAKEYARQQNTVSLVLINGAQLAHYMQEYGLGTTISQTYEIKTIDQDFFNPEGT